MSSSEWKYQRSTGPALNSNVVRVRAVEHRPLNNAPVGHFTTLLCPSHKHTPKHKQRCTTHPHTAVAVAVAPMANVFGEKFIGTPCAVAFVSIPSSQRVTQMCLCVCVFECQFVWDVLHILFYLYANHVLFVSSRLRCPVFLLPLMSCSHCKCFRFKGRANFSQKAPP